ncbi:MAG: hypothetical protein AB3N13_13785 [Arenibacterium sp.]
MADRTGSPVRASFELCSSWAVGLEYFVSLSPFLQSGIALQKLVCLLDGPYQIIVTRPDDPIPDAPPSPLVSGLDEPEAAEFDIGDVIA